MLIRQFIELTYSTRMNELDTVAEMIDKDEAWREIIINAEMSVGDYFLSLVDGKYDDFCHMIQSIGDEGIKELVNKHHVGVHGLAVNWLCDYAKELMNDTGIVLQFDDDFDASAVIKDVLKNYGIHGLVK